MDVYGGFMQNEYREHKWKCLDGDCLFQDVETGEVFYSTPVAPIKGTLTIVGLVCGLAPVLVGLTMYLTMR